MILEIGGGRCGGLGRICVNFDECLEVDFFSVGRRYQIGRIVPGDFQGVQDFLLRQRDNFVTGQE